MHTTQVPLLKVTGAPDAARLKKLRGFGYEAISYQVQNGDKVSDFDFSPARQAGVQPRVWGVTYSQDRFYADGLSLGTQAMKLGAEGEVIMDAEMAAKFTRATRGMQPVIQGIRDAGWQGPISLNTMGPPYNPLVNDYEIDTDSFLATGGGVYTQAYANETDSFKPLYAMQYWTRIGIPFDRLNITISLYPAEADKEYPGRMYDGATYVPLLKEAGVKRNLSIFMEPALTDADLQALSVLTLSPTPKPPVSTKANYDEALAKLSSSVDEWRKQGKDEEYVATRRQTVARRVLLATQDAEDMNTLNAALDAIGAPK